MVTYLMYLGLIKKYNYLCFYVKFSEREDANDTMLPEKITRSGRMLRRPKQYEDYGPF